MARPRILLVPNLTELEWLIKPQLEEWAEVASFDAPGVGAEPRPDTLNREAIIRRALAPPFAGIVALDRRDPVDHGQTRYVVRLEHDSTATQRLDRRFDVLDLPGHLRERAGRGARGLEQCELAARAAVEKSTRSLFAGLEAELLR